MDELHASIEIEKLIRYGVNHGLINELDCVPARNSLLDLLQIANPYEGNPLDEQVDNISEILDSLLDYASEKGLIPCNTSTWRDLFDTRIMGMMMPRQSEVAEKFLNIKEKYGIDNAVDYYYGLSVDSNYIRADRIARNLCWETYTDYGSLEITINLSKPEKDPKDIAASRALPQNNYPKCLLCADNAGYAGNLNHPARQNLRLIPLTLAEEQWFFQYSPYVYYNEHCIVLHSEHIPMNISHTTFIRLFDFLDMFPRYFIGSNAGIPIVGGSILNHEHFQGGRHIFPMEKAPIETEFVHKSYPDIKGGIVKWPMSVLRLSCSDRGRLTELSSCILDMWREYSDQSADIISYSKKDGEKVLHNAITPIARKNLRCEYEIDLVFRNNRTSCEHPDGIFHPHRELHHIKKENIGLIEVLGLAVLPGRLKLELDMIKDILTGTVRYKDKRYDEKDDIYKHINWIEYLVGLYGTDLSPGKAGEIIRYEVGLRFLRVLLDAGVFKKDESGSEAFNRFLSHIGFHAC